MTLKVVGIGSQTIVSDPPPHRSTPGATPYPLLFRFRRLLPEPQKGGNVDGFPDSVKSGFLLAVLSQHVTVTVHAGRDRVGRPRACDSGEHSTSAAGGRDPARGRLVGAHGVTFCSGKACAGAVLVAASALPGGSWPVTARDWTAPAEIARRSKLIRAYWRDQRFGCDAW
jgi:hypothetical protein